MAFEELASELTLDAGDYISEAGSASDASQDLAGSTDEVEGSMSRLNGVAAGAAIAGVGAAAQKTLDSTQGLREGLGRTATNLGITRDEAEQMATSMSNATFPLDDVEGTMGNLAAMTETPAQMEEVALAADSIADATGTSASSISKNLAPVVNALDGDLNSLVESQDAFTIAANESTLSVEDISQTMSRLDFSQLKQMGLTASDTAGLMSQFADQSGFTGRQLESNFNQAVKAADGDLGQLTTELGLGENAVEQWNQKVQEGAGATDEYASSANESLSAMDKVRSRVDDMALKFSGLIEPVSAAAPAMMALGTTMAALAASGITASSAMAGVGTAATAMLGPLGLVLLAVAALGAAFATDFMGMRTAVENAIAAIRPHLQTVITFFRDRIPPTLKQLRSDAETVFNAIQTAVTTFVGVVRPPLERLFSWFSTIYATHIQPVEQEFSKTFTVWSGAISRFVSWVRPYVETFVGWFTTAVRSLWNVVEPLFDAHLNNIIEIVSFAFDVVRTVVEQFIDAFTTAIRVFLNILQGDFDGALNEIRGFFSRTFDRITGLASSFKQTIITVITNLIDGILGLVRNLDLAGAFDSVVDSAVTRVENFGDDFRSAGEGLIDAVVDGIKDAPGAVKNAVEDVVGDARDYLPFSPAKEGPLSDLDKSGESLPQTFAEGIASHADEVPESVGEMVPDADVDDAPVQRRRPGVDRGQRSTGTGIGAGDDRTDELLDKLDQVVDRLERLDSGDVRVKDVLKALDVSLDRARMDLS